MANTQTFIGDGSTTKFYFTFPFFGTADIHVTVNNISLTSDDFTVYPETSPEPADTEYIGGHIETATAPATGATIKVFRNIELVRHIDYQPTTEPLAHQLNQDFNQCMAALNEMTEKLENTLSLASIPNLADLLSELTTIRESFPNFLTEDDLESLNTAISNLDDAITTLNGYDYVVASQSPTSENNYTWYRKYKSGWIEQGGIVSSSEQSSFAVTLPIEMSNTNYTVQLVGPYDANGTLVMYGNVQTTGFTRYATNRAGTGAPRETRWQVSGFVAA